MPSHIKWNYLPKVMDRVNTFSLGDDESSKYLHLEIDRKIYQQKHTLDHIVHFPACDCFDYHTKHTLP